MKLKIDLLQVSDFQQNCRLIYEPVSRRAVLIDPGAEPDKILNRIESLGLLLEGIYLTHSHLDHCGAVAPLLSKIKVPLYAHAAEHDFRSRISAVAQMYGIPPGFYFNCPEPDVCLENGMETEILGVPTKIIATPGHSPGSVSLWMPSESLIFSGDVLFFDSIGRTDLPGGDYATLINSIRGLIDNLPPETRVLSGHGPDTTLGREKECNPFLAG